MTFVTPAGESFAPDASVTYVKALWSFARGVELDGRPLDSAITAPTVRVVEDVMVSLLNNDRTFRLVGEAWAGDAAVSGAVRADVSGETTWAAKEVMSAAGVSPLGELGHVLSAKATAVTEGVLQSGVGKAVLVGVTKVAVTTQGKVLIGKLVTAAAAKVAASAALKAFVLTAVKKVGVGLVVKLVLTKVLAAALPAVVVAKIPIFWIILPVVAAFIVHEIKTIPSKLANRLPDEVGDKMHDAFPSIARQFAAMIVSEVVEDVKRSST